MMKSWTLLASAGMVLANPAAAAGKDAAEWVRVGSHVDGGAVEVDRKSITTSAGLTRAWWRTSFAEPRQDGTTREKQLMAIDCGEGLSTVLAAVSLAADGSVLSEVREPEGAALRRLGPVTPGTTGERVAKAACDLRPRPRPKRR
jgi:hypothetical protein